MMLKDRALLIVVHTIEIRIISPENVKLNAQMEHGAIIMSVSASVQHYFMDILKRDIVVILLIGLTQHYLQTIKRKLGLQTVR